jgi:periplasmic copper chaperone A
LARALVLLLLAVALAPPAASAHSHKKKGLEIVHPWTPATTEKTAATTPVFMKIKNAGAADRLLRASTPVAASVALQEAVAADASQAAKPVAAIVVGAGTDVDLVRNGPHLLLSGLKKRLDAYDTFKLTLVFEKAGSMVVEVAVEEAATVEPHKH